MQDQIKLGIISTTSTSSTTTTTTSNTTPSTTASTSSSSTLTTGKEAPKSSSWLPPFNLTTKVATTTETTPHPPLTLSLGAWQITEEDLPIYVGSAAGVLLLIILLLGVTTWRCCIVPSHPANQAPKAKEDQSKPFQKYPLLLAFFAVFLLIVYIVWIL